MWGTKSHGTMVGRLSSRAWPALVIGLTRMLLKVRLFVLSLQKHQIGNLVFQNHGWEAKSETK